VAIRTPDPRLRRPILYPLSYRRICRPKKAKLILPSNEGTVKERRIVTQYGG
jgi:hypothetical protein